MSEVAEALRLMRKVVRLPLGRNCHYKQADFFRLLSEMSCLNSFAEGVSNASRGVVPQADDLFYHLKKLRTGEVQEAFDELMARNLKLARRLGLLRKPVELAADFTTEPYYGEPNGFVRGGQKKAGTHWGFQYLTASIVQDGKRFVIAALPYLPLDGPAELLERLLDECKALVRIERLLLDRGFFTKPVLSLLERGHWSYVIPGVRNKKVARLEREVTCFPASIPFELNGAATKLVFVKDADDTLIFCTNLQCWRGKLPEYYSKRWGIETTYRVTDCLQSKTCSRNHAVRVFLSYFAIALYNALQLAKALAPREREPITLTLRLFIINQTLPTAGSRPP